MDSQYFDHIVVHLYWWRYVVDKCYHSTNFHSLLDIKVFEKDTAGDAVLFKPSRCLNVLMNLMSQENKIVCQKFRVMSMFVLVISVVWNWKRMNKSEAL